MHLSTISRITPDSATAGPKAEAHRASLPAPLESPDDATKPRRLPRARPWRSLVVKTAMLAFIFVVVPLILYSQFKAADDEKQQLLLRSVGDQGRVMAQALAPLVAASEKPNLARLQQELARFADDVTNVKLLFKPAAAVDSGGFYYIASWPVVPASQLDIEGEKLRQQGILSQLATSCEGELPMALRYTTPQGGEEVVTSLTPIRAPSGCWAVVTSFAAGAIPGAHFGVPYWATAEVRISAVVYLAMALLTFTTFWSIRRGLRRFADRARAVSEGGAHGSFGEQNDIPELAEVAQEFDRMVERLKKSAEDIRRAAEDNAHAFKTPIAVIRQSLEPLRRTIEPDNQRGLRALGLIESSLDKLDGLVASQRRLDEATADIINTKRMPVDLSRLVHQLLDAQAGVFARRRLSLKGHVTPGVIVMGDEEMIETVIENLIENAVSFSPEGESIGVRLETRGQSAELLVGDSGPGVPEADLERIFERYFSQRPARKDGDGGTHFGIGLWIARRNVEALGGTIRAENRRPNGLLMRVLLPLAPGVRIARPDTTLPHATARTAR
ncbi:MAG: HAMP domain-containing histidine kinase [Rhodospirillales bacterium]|nr:HAMP domain-containing histidine kinase [Rhodospirillales bacterium]